MILYEYCVCIYEKRYGSLVKQYHTNSKKKAVEIHQKYTKKGYRAVIVDWSQMQQA